MSQRARYGRWMAYRRKRFLYKNSRKKAFRAYWIRLAPSTDSSFSGMWWTYKTEVPTGCGLRMVASILQSSLTWDILTVFPLGNCSASGAFFSFVETLGGTERNFGLPMGQSMAHASSKTFIEVRRLHNLAPSLQILNHPISLSLRTSLSSRRL